MDQNELTENLAEYRGSKIYAGFSGGADSTALLLLLAKCREKLLLDIEAVHFDHRLRPDSQDDAQWCMNFCSERNVKFKHITLDVTGKAAPGEGVEAAARRLRLEHWEKIAKPGELIALGHHRDDRVENTFLRLCRGSNVSGITSMRREQTIGKLTFIRPLLDWTRNDIEKFLSESGIDSWREDSSNKDCRYRRNFFRNKVLPDIYQEMPFAATGIARSIEVMELDAELIERLAADQFKDIDNQPEIETGWFVRQPPALAIRILRMWLCQQAGHDIIPDCNLLERIYEMSITTSNSGSRIVPVGAKLSLQVHDHKITLCNDSVEPVPDRINWFWRGVDTVEFGKFTLHSQMLAPKESQELNASNAVFDADKISDTLIIRSWKNGDKMTVPGHDSPVKLKKLFIDRKITAADKPFYPVVTLSNGTPIWVAGVRRSDIAMLTKETRRALLITMKEK